MLVILIRNMSTISEKFRHRITSVWGEKGSEWLERLPTIITACQERWALSIKSPAPELSFNFVAFVVKADGAEAVLKIGVPDTELMTEIEALRLYQGRGAVELLDADRHLGALLLKRLRPGRHLSDLENDEKATVIAAQLMRELPIPAPSNHHFPTIGRWALAFNRLRERFEGKTGPLPLRMVDKAEQLWPELQASSPGEMLLHGDLHHDNILSNGENGWLAIDPKGVIGDPAYEAARFQHNPIPHFLSMDHPQQVVQRRVGIMASILQQDQARLLAWGFFDAMLGACWSVEDNGDDWPYFIACAEILEAMVD